MIPIFLAGYCLGIATLWIFLELLALIMCRRAPPVTLHHRKNRDAAERRVSREGWEGIDYKFLGMGDREDVR